MCKIRDIYAGKPDAKDEVTFDGIQKFIEAFIIPENFNLDSLITGDKMFITGYKGTGKTALLHYLDSQIDKKFSKAFSSFIFFKGDFPDSKLSELDELSKKLFSYITFDDAVIRTGNDFECIWRWLFYQRIIEDNESFSFSLFENDKNWKDFKKELDAISFTKKKRWLFIPDKIKFSCPLTTPETGVNLAPEFELNFYDSNVFETENYRRFSEIINQADKKFEKLTRTDSAYYIFVDELEAYFADEDVFCRDLKIIRDLIFTVKLLNSCFLKFAAKTKIICSVRTEILKAINRFIIPKELNKVTSGYEAALIWDYTNTNSFSHPILKILTKRILMAEKNKCTEKELINKWFPSKINRIDTAHYILNNSWNKPRDIVRLILTAQNSLCATNTMFDQSTFDTIQKRYSLESLTEIKEELRALYSSDEIQNIVSLFTGFKIHFTIEDLKERIDSYFPDFTLRNKITQLLNDLYRVGFVGNWCDGAFRWQHRGDDELIINSDWKIRIHNALIQALSLNTQNLNRVEKAKVYDVKIMKKEQDKLIVCYQEGNDKQWGHIKISPKSSFYPFLKEGNNVKARYEKYDEFKKIHILKLIQ